MWREFELYTQQSVNRHLGDIEVSPADVLNAALDILDHEEVLEQAKHFAAKREEQLEHFNDYLSEKLDGYERGLNLTPEDVVRAIKIMPTHPAILGRAILYWMNREAQRMTPAQKATIASCRHRDLKSLEDQWEALSFFLLLVSAPGYDEEGIVEPAVADVIASCEEAAEGVEEAHETFPSDTESKGTIH